MVRFTTHLRHRGLSGEINEFRNTPTYFGEKVKSVTPEAMGVPHSSNGKKASAHMPGFSDFQKSRQLGCVGSGSSQIEYGDGYIDNALPIAKSHLFKQCDEYLEIGWGGFKIRIRILDWAEDAIAIEVHRDAGNLTTKKGIMAKLEFAVSSEH